MMDALRRKLTFHPPEEPKKIDFKNRDKLVQAITSISYLASHAKDAKTSEELYNAYKQIIEKAELGISFFQENDNFEVIQKQLQIKDVELHLDGKISDIEEKLKAKEEAIKKLFDELTETQKIKDLHEAYCRSKQAELEKQLEEMREKVEVQTDASKAAEEQLRLKEEEMLTKLNELTVAQQNISALEEKIEVLNSDFKKLQMDINITKEQLKSQKATYEIEIRKKNEKIENQKREYEEQLKQSNELREDIKNLTDTKKSLTENNKGLIETNKSLTETNESLNNAVKQLSSFDYQQEIDPEIPYISIQSSSLLSLQAKSGWPVIYPHKENKENKERLEKLQKQKIPTLGFIGPQGTGKSWLANLLNGGGLPYGPSNNEFSDSLTAFYPELRKKGGHVCFLDSRGFDKLNPANQTNKGAESLSKESNSKDEIPFLHRLQLICEDSKIIKENEQNFIIQESSLVVYVTDGLTQADLENICAINRKLLQTQSISKRTHQLIVVHNLKSLKNIKQVEDYITLLKDRRLKFERENLFNTNEEAHKLKGKFEWLFKDEFGVTHLIMAQNYSDAAAYYNESAITFLLLKLEIDENKKAWDFTRVFVDFCNTSLSGLANCEVKVKLDQSESEAKIVAAEDCKIETDRICCNYVSNPFATNGFEPRYSIQVFKRGEDTVYEVFVELLDSKINQSSLKCQNGRHYLVIAGERSDVVVNGEEANDTSVVERLKGTREAGTLHVKIPLAKNMNHKIKEPSKTEVGAGIFKFTCLFEPEKMDFD